jgi:hypothetical protein
MKHKIIVVAALALAVGLPCAAEDRACTLVTPAKVDVKTFGPITCSTIIPAKDKEMYGFNTTCSVLKGTTVAAIEITSKSRAAMVPIEKLRPVAEKMATRF